MMIKTAVILAAGLGSRFKDVTKNKPKAFIEVDGETLIERSIRKLIFNGIEKIIIGTGYLSEHFEKLAQKYPLITCVKSDKYETTSSMYTLYNLRKEVKSDFLLLEGDLLYERDGLKTLINDYHVDAILASGKTHSGDEVYLELDKKNNLVNLSKKPAELKSVDAELVGISKISLATFEKMCEFAEKALISNPKIDYEHVFVEVSTKFQGIYVKKIENYAWTELDDESHLKRALDEVYPRILEREAMQSIKRNVLLNPGPATTTDSVKYAQVQADICPREKEFGELMHYVADELTLIVGNLNDHVTVLFGGSGTAVVEAIISSVIDKDAVLVINNGSYGARICEMTRIYDYDLIEYQSSPMEPIDLVKLEKTIQASSKKIGHLVVIHHETTTGLLNDIEAIGALCKKHGITFIVDAMSSYAAVPIDMNRMHISYLAASSNKNIQGMAGVGFVICNKKELEKTKSIKKRNLYLNLYAQYEYFAKTSQTRFTPPVQTLYALRQAIIEAKIEGIANRYKRYSDSWQALIDTLEAIKMPYLIDKKYHSKIIVSIMEPKTPLYNFDQMHDFFISHGYTIYPGKVSNLDTFRISNIGQMDKKDMEAFLVLFKDYLKKIAYL